LRDTHPQFEAAGLTVVAIAPHDADDTAKFLRSNSYPFAVLPDPDGAVFKAYDVTSRLLSLGQQPAAFVVGPDGKIVFDAVGGQQWDLVDPTTLLAAAR
jgi:peroxiredoxin